jgi:GTP-binding protein
MRLPHFASCTVADIPGLIEGASKGQGLGDRFLRHIERTRLLVHLVPVDADPRQDPETLWHQFELVNHELSSYSDALAERPQIVVITKSDESIPEAMEEIVAHFQGQGVEPIVISALMSEGLEPLVLTIDERLHALLTEEAVDNAAHAGDEEPTGITTDDEP